MKNLILTSLFLFFTCSITYAQMEINGQSLFGNEWIDYDKTYYKLSVEEDGVYRVSMSELSNAGMPVTSIEGKELKLYYFGESYPVYVSNTGSLDNSDFIEFLGLKNRGELDKQLYKEWETMQLNPNYSLFTDKSVYYLTWEDGSDNEMRIKDLANNVPAGADFETYYMHEEILEYNKFHHKPTYIGTDKIRYSYFDITEGFGSTLKSNVSMDFPISSFFAEAQENPTLKLRFGSNDPQNGHSLEISTDGDVLFEEDFNDYKLFDLSLDLNDSQIKDITKVNVKGNAGSSDRYSIAYGILNYPRAFVFETSNAIHYNIESNQNTSYYNFENFGGQTIIAFDSEGQNRIQTSVNGSNIRFGIPGGEQRILHVYDNDSGIKSVSSVREKDFIDYTNINPSYLMLTSEKLNNSEGEENLVLKYSDYRKSPQGGSYDTYIVNVEDLYDQFSYGVARSSMSIRNFGHYIRDNWDAIELIYIVGKGIEYSRYRTAVQQEDPDKPEFYVPSWGVPASDNLLFSEKGSFVPFRGIGRIACQNKDQLKDYFDKVQVHENSDSFSQSIEDLAWKKRVIHLSGGDPNIQLQIFNHLGDMREILEENDYGADITTFKKTSVDPLQDANSVQILNALNDGASILTFFGHSAVGTFDFSLEDPSAYDNYGVWPFIMSLGCHSGNIHSSSSGLSENFVLEKDKGSIAFLAASSTAYIHTQYTSGKNFYESLGNNLYGSPLGLIIREMIESKKDLTSIGEVTLQQQLTFHGDPALILQNFNAPDYALDYSSAAVDPSVVSTGLDSFEFCVDIYNIGKVINSELDVSITHELPSGQVFKTIQKVISAPSNSSQLCFKVPNPGIDGQGRNKIKVVLDLDNKIAELAAGAEDNNELRKSTSEIGFDFFILDETARPIYPENFGIVNESSNLTLKASSTNIFLEKQDYHFEIDSTETFDSPLLETGVINSGGGIIEWSPLISLDNNTVYYWRVSPKPRDANVGFMWSNSSFIYLPESSEGWNQSHYYQYRKNDLSLMDVNEETRRFENRQVFFDNTVYNQFPNADTWWNFFNGQRVNALNPLDDAPFLAIFGMNGRGWVRNENLDDFGSFPYRPIIFLYRLDKPEDTENIKALLASIPDKTRVVVMTMLKNEESSLNVDLWDDVRDQLGYNIIDVLEDYGSTKANGFTQNGTVPYTFIFDKGGEVINEAIGENITDFHTISYNISRFAHRGSFVSTDIGPAKAWRNLEWNLEEVGENDVVELKVIGIKADGSVDTLYTIDETENSFDLSEVSTNVYPYLKLVYDVNDPTLPGAVGPLTPQLKYWRINYKGLPESIINTDESLVFESDTLNRGETLSFLARTTNISSLDMDSLLVKYSILDVNNNSEDSFSRKGPLLKNGVQELSFEKNTSDMSGDYTFIVETNPNDDQIERFHFNNLGIKKFHVRTDNINPVLDVKFDGITILDYDIVSATPEIKIELKDDNKFLLLDDANAFQLAVIDPNGNREDLTADDQRLEFIPASETNNKAQLIFRPQFEIEGEYEMFVQGVDKSGNFSGDLEYTTHFRVILESTISEVFNYPNPFSTKTKFVFTLTGTSVPDDMAISIYTMSGKLVKVIRSEELGPLRIGNNITEYEWNGSDDFGTKLANGVYLFKVDFRNKEEFKKFNGAATSFTKDGFGKLVIMR